MVTYTDEDKGDEVNFVGGTYLGLTGWRWKGKVDTPKMVSVIVRKEDGTEYGTRLKKDNVKVSTPPINRVEAALDQHPDIEGQLDKLCKFFAQCAFDGEEKDLYVAITKRMQAAISRQRSEGLHASWREVIFDEA